MRVALVARMLTDKGVRDSVAAMGILAERDAPVHLLLVGGPDPENPSSISENELRSWESERVTWLGPRRDVAEILATCDVGLLPSYREGMPRSLLEAASCGLPVVTTDVPGCRELVSDGVNGLVVPVRDPVALADALERLAGSPAERARMGRNARRIVLERYCDAVILDQFMALYRQGLSRPTTSPAEAADVSPTVLDIRQRQRHRATAHEIGDRHP